MSTTKRQRDYKKEYQQRIKRAEALAKLAGVKFSRSQARGHAKPTEQKISQVKREKKLPNHHTSTLKKMGKLLSKMFGGASFTQAAKASKIAPRTAKNVGLTNGTLQKADSKRIGVIARKMRVVSTTGIHENVPLDQKAASINGTHLNLVKHAYSNPESRKKLKAIKPKTIKDLNGNSYKLQTDFEALMLMGYYNDFSTSREITPEDSSDIEADDEKIYKKEVV